MCTGRKPKRSEMCDFWAVFHEKVSSVLKRKKLYNQSFHYFFILINVGPFWGEGCIFAGKFFSHCFMPLFSRTRPDGFAAPDFQIFFSGWLWDWNEPHIVAEPAITPSKALLNEIMPLPMKQAPKAPRQPKEPFPSYVITEPNTRNFIKRKDKDWKKGVQDATKKMNKGMSHNQIKDRDKKLDVPQPFFEGREGMECQICYGMYGEDNFLTNQKYWVNCPYCKVDNHYICLVYSGECVCGKKLRLQRKQRSN